MTGKMHAAVVEQFGKPLVLQEWDIPVARARPDPGQDGGLRRLPYRSARRRRRLAAEADAAFHPGP